MNALRLNSVLGWFVSTTKEFVSNLNKANSNRSARYRDSFTQIGPYSLVQLAYQGRLIRQGIPSQAALVDAHRNGHINTVALVKSAVKAKLVSDTPINTAYLNAVETAFLFCYLLHPAELSQQKNTYPTEQHLGTAETVRRIEQHYFLERRRFW